MKKLISIKISLFVVLCIFTTQNTAFALAGFAESESKLYYNEYADLNWMHPYDGCMGQYPYGQNCFYLIEKNKLINPFMGNLLRVTISDYPNRNIVLMEAADGKWHGYGRFIVYDLKSKGVVSDTDNYSLALDTWRKEQGLLYLHPQFATAIDLSNYFEGTKEQKAEDLKENLTFLGVFLLVVVFLFSTLFGIWKLFKVLFWSFERIWAKYKGYGLHVM